MKNFKYFLRVINVSFCFRSVNEAGVSLLVLVSLVNNLRTSATILAKTSTNRPNAQHQRQ